MNIRRLSFRQKISVVANRIRWTYLKGVHGPTCTDSNSKRETSWVIPAQGLAKHIDPGSYPVDWGNPGSCRA